MQAAFCTQAGIFELRNTERPALAEESAAGQVVVRVRSCGICGSDLHYFHGGFPPPQVCPGHEICGEVAEVGGGVQHLTVGDRVAVEPLVVCGRCPYCRVGDYQLCTQFQLLGTVLDGGFAEYLRVRASALFRLPVGIDCEVGALTEPLAVAAHAVRLANLRLGDRVLVLGAGTIGLLSVAAARAAGAAEVWITARHPHQRAAAEGCGATRLFGAGDDGSELYQAAGTAPPDIVIETVGGTADTLNQAIHLVRPGGCVALLGIFTTMPTFNALSFVLKEVRLVGSLTYGRAGTRADFDVALQLLAAEPERFRALITHRFPLRDITRGFETAADKGSGSIKVAIQPT